MARSDSWAVHFLTGWRSGCNPAGLPLGLAAGCCLASGFLGFRRLWPGPFLGDELVHPPVHEHPKVAQPTGLSKP